MPSEAEKKFWGCPELVENLIPFMDFYAIVCLTQVDTLSQIPITSSQIPSIPAKIPSTPTQIPSTPFQMPSNLHPILFPVSLPFLDTCSIMLHTGAQACPGCCPGQNCLEQADQAGLLILPAFYYLSSMLGCKMQMSIFSQQVCQGIRKGKNRDRLDQMKEFGLMKMQVTNILHSNLKYNLSAFTEEIH